MIVCAILITIAQNLNLDRPNDEEGKINGIGIFLITSTLAFVVFFALGPGSIPWLITGEVFDHRSRAGMANKTLVLFININVIIF